MLISSTKNRVKDGKKGEPDTHWDKNRFLFWFVLIFFFLGFTFWSTYGKFCPFLDQFRSILDSFLGLVSGPFLFILGIFLGLLRSVWVFFVHFGLVQSILNSFQVSFQVHFSPIWDYFEVFLGLVCFLFVNFGSTLVYFESFLSPFWGFFCTFRVHFQSILCPFESILSILNLFLVHFWFLFCIFSPL